MDSKKKVTVKIFGTEYTVVGEFTSGYILGIANKVDEIMKKISSKNNKYNPTMIAVLTALNITNDLYMKTEEYEILNKECSKLKYEFEKSNTELKNIKKDFSALQTHYNSLHKDYTVVQVEIKKLNKENTLYKDEIKDSKFELDVAKNTINELQNKLFENQIELLKVKKELDDVEKINIK